MGIRGIVAGSLVLLAAALAVASAIYRYEAEAPRISRTIWPNHPDVLQGLVMAQIGQAAALGQLPSGRTMERVRKLAARAPLEPEPFLIEAVLAQKRGEGNRAVRLLIEARRRDPRSPGARYLLADQLIRSGDIVGGLKEMTVLTRLVPGAADQLVPGLAAYARTPGAITELRLLFRESPDLEPVLLFALASEPQNADLALAIAQPSSFASEPGQWRTRLLETLISAGMYSKAYSVWTRFAGVAPQSGLYRPDFSSSPAPPPFNWVLAKAGGGLAEPAPGGGLRVFHYGREETSLANQIILLRPGSYALATAVAGDLGAEGQLRWQIRCLPSRSLLFDFPLSRASAKSAKGKFQVPGAGCDAQRIDLIGVPTDSSRSINGTISPLRLSQVAS